MIKIWLDPGHGGKDSGAADRGLFEKILTLTLVNKIVNGLEKYEGVQLGFSRLTDKYVSLDERTSAANKWGADFFLSVHINSAASSSARGFESFIYERLSDSSKTAKLQGVIHNEIVKKTHWVDRGKKKANFHVLRESAMPALLTENGFINNVTDSNLLRKDDYLQKVADGHVQGLAAAFNLKLKKQQQPATPKKLYYVQAGAFTDKTGAEKLVKQLKEKGFQAIIK